MSESDFCTVNSRYKAQGAAGEWPAWELQGYGTAAPAPEPVDPDDPDVVLGLETAPPRLDPLGPWFSARLTFADGARIDVLVAVSDDGLTVEDMRADPPLTLDELATLGRWIDGPLDDACRLATGRPRKGRTPEEWHQEPGQDLGQDLGAHRDEAGDGAPAQEVATPPVEAAVHGEGALCGQGERLGDADRTAAVCDRTPRPAEPADAPDSAEAPESAGPPERAEQPVGPRAPAAPPADPGAPPAVLARSRVSERRRLAADAYRTAQRTGQDPVLAVMNATGRNRRRSLRLIAGARDEGFLTPRHNKR
ncbi:DUF6214 family protein [Streptomyces sp. NPDC048483]|uniref:DUF6214 family protein n=1 Tax=Streptomyces sp. NPDC048483 TaxID=3154927 RepID=UPI00341AFAB6